MVDERGKSSYQRRMQDDGHVGRVEESDRIVPAVSAPGGAMFN